MSRFSAYNIEANNLDANQIASYSTNQYKPQTGAPRGPTEEQIRLQEMRAAWPQNFPKPIIGLDRDGVINFDRGHYLTKPEEWEPIPGSLEAIRMMRLKGYKVVILTNQGGIAKGLQTHEQVDAVNNYMMQVFGEAGIFTIDGLYYAESSLKDDYYAKPNLGMFHRAEKEIFAGKHRFKQKGFYVGDKMSDLKAAHKIGATPVLVRTGHGEETESLLQKFSAEKIRKKAKVFDSLLDFAKVLK
jgi:D-glycero-D-manno-heptose 1,7-bisphosphate phosphatase